MADIYTIELVTRVTKGEDKLLVVEETSLFANQGFSQMVNKMDRFYKLTSELTGKK